ncbi:hypothetical protein IWW38_000832 [Coemansia aciculifera]|uniref:Uncharacterized protein n=1 Tax=Coemansia aciculifera TaxID=417176 RepID=A0ACC1M7Y6_9FUNG|nr:hypothetical protein IWW38_000832 [Coemansia aciculifera]
MKMRSPSMSSGSAEIASLEPRANGWHKIANAERYSELTVRKGTAVLVWTIPHVIILAYNLAQHQIDLQTRIDGAARSCILLDVAAVLLFMSPAFIMLLRRTFLPRFVSLEKNVHAHSAASYTLLFWTIVHIEPIRRYFFEAFYYIHHLFILHLVLLFIHNQNHLTYKYLSGPLALYCTDRLYRNLRTVFAKSPIRAVIQHPAGVVELRLEKRIIGHRPGQYVKLCCPSVSLLQWHPVTISSAPEEELLILHFRLAGGWTRSFADRLGCSFGANARSSAIQKVVAGSAEIEASGVARHLYSVAAANPELFSPPSISVVARASKEIAIEPSAFANSLAEMSTLAQMESGDVVIRLGAELPVIYVDGPYSVPTERFFEYEVGVLIAAGIGITPMASVLRSVYFKWLQGRDHLPSKKVYVFWVFRDIGTIEWFKDLLIALEEEGLNSIVKVCTYFTGEIPESHISQLAPAKDRFGKHLIATPIGTQSYVGRPDFGTIFETIGELHADTRVGTFLCGPKPMIREVRREARKWDARLCKSTKTTIDFFSEHF